VKIWNWWTKEILKPDGFVNNLFREIYV